MIGSPKPAKRDGSSLALIASAATCGLNRAMTWERTGFPASYAKEHFKFRRSKFGHYSVEPLDAYVEVDGAPARNGMAVSLLVRLSVRRWFAS
jgi:hypothetical protein